MSVDVILHGDIETLKQRAQMCRKYHLDDATAARYEAAAKALEGGKP